jgi:hypothetical protein
VVLEHAAELLGGEARDRARLGFLERVECGVGRREDREWTSAFERVGEAGFLQRRR